MTPDQFIEKWRRTTTSERAASQEHFIDLCRLLEQPTPHEIDPDGRFYAFERGAARTGMATGGWADVWKRGHFGWEYKRRSGGRSTTLAKALQQLQLYALALESPPLLVVSDIDVIEIHTAFQNAVQAVHTIQIEELAEPATRRLLGWVFDTPEQLRPQTTRDQATAAAAERFAGLADQLRARGHEPEKVAHFLNRLLFCMYAEDAGLLREELFTELLERAGQVPDDGDDLVARLFSVMRSGGTFGLERVHRFNGGLFDSDETVPLSRDEFLELGELARMDWSQIEPALFGTLFERGLDPDKRAQLGAHYTDAGSIHRIVDAVVTAPLETE